MHRKAPRRSASYVGLKPASARASAAAKASSKKSGTKCEIALRKALWKRGLRYRLSCGALPGRPDLVFPKYRAVIFCDGDFWHGRDLPVRLERLQIGHNATYWTQKIQKNVERDHRNNTKLKRLGWRVFRVWESDIFRNVEGIATRLAASIARGISHHGS